MKLWHVTLLSVLITTQGWAGVKTYFNHNPKSSYTDPYRKITRPGDNLEGVLLEQIAKAKKTIFVAVMELRLPLVAQALVAKKKAGVDVRVVVEHDYNFTVMSQPDSGSEEEATKVNELRALVDVNGDNKISKEELQSRDAIYILRQGKVNVVDDTFDNSSGSGLMHHKFVVIDGKTTIVSTANFTLSCVHGDVLAPTSRGNANSMLVINSKQVSDIFVEEFSQLWGTGKRGNFGHNKTYRGPQQVTVGDVKISVQFSPTSQRYHWEESTNGLIAEFLGKATKSIKGALFVLSDQRMGDVLEKRNKAGVELGFLVESKFAFRDYSELLDMAGVEMLSPKCTYEADNRPWKKPISEIGTVSLAKGDVLHHKFAIIDNKAVVVGSQNWSDAANVVNDETLVVIQDKIISDQYTQEYNRLKRKARLGLPETIQEEIELLEEECADSGFYF